MESGRSVGEGKFRNWGVPKRNPSEELNVLKSF